MQGTLTQDREGSHKLHAVFVELEVDRPGIQDGADQAPFSRAKPWEVGKLRQGMPRAQTGLLRPTHPTCTFGVVRHDALGLKIAQFGVTHDGPQTVPSPHRV